MWGDRKKSLLFFYNGIDNHLVHRNLFSFFRIIQACHLNWEYALGESFLQRPGTSIGCLRQLVYQRFFSLLKRAAVARATTTSEIEYVLLMQESQEPYIKILSVGHATLHPLLPRGPKKPQKRVLSVMQTTLHPLQSQGWQTTITSGWWKFSLMSSERFSHMVIWPHWETITKDMSVIIRPFCKILKWIGEFSRLCCSNRKIRLPDLQNTPQPFLSLLFGQHPDSHQFMRKKFCSQIHSWRLVYINFQNSGSNLSLQRFYPPWQQ